MTTTEASDADVQAAAPTLGVKIGAGASAFAGLMTALTGIQIVVAVYVDGIHALFPWLMLLGGAAMIGLAVPAGRGRFWAAAAVLAADAFGGLTALAWLVLSFTGGFFSCFALVTVPITVAAIVAAIFALGPAKKTSEAQRRLRRSGMEFGI